MEQLTLVEFMCEWAGVPRWQGLVYDYYVDEATGALTPWEDRVPKFTYTPGNFSNLFVPTVETTRISYFLDSLIANKHHVMLVGSTGAASLPLASFIRHAEKSMRTAACLPSCMLMPPYDGRFLVQASSEQLGNCFDSCLLHLHQWEDLVQGRGRRR